ncbi:helix-turn-helix transcriptional regulator [Paenibacillus mendelii]|uniref:Helix-turn-helix transcriptional regulator n=1 Tax=Paenibacillus mendelii TaxID=206163 RepID=A0ABV6J4S1_9BACL|nr:helix-turn-helix transcriptional regulator [Paenibacillus mendelii]MCQ6560420.1 helix-turn-helix transcriptional regulator [Paenibacillus mendelii]
MPTFQFISPPLPHYIVSGEDVYPAGGEHPSRNRIAVFDLIVVTGGTLYISEGEEQWQVEGGHCLVLRPDRYHYPTRPCREETHFYWLHFSTCGTWGEVLEPGMHVINGDEEEDADGTIPEHAMDDESADALDHLPSIASTEFSQMDAFSIYVPRHVKLRNPDAVYKLLERIALLDQTSSAATKWEQQIRFQELLMILKDERGDELVTPQIAVAERAAAFLRTRYRVPVSYAELAEELHFHPNYISRCMKRVYGCTPLEYVTRYRIEQAKRLLIHTNDAIGKVAEEAGFASFPFFVRSFAKHTGFRPREFRKHYRR